MRIAVIIYRISRWFYLRKLRLISFCFDMANRLLFSCWCPGASSIGSNFILGYGGLSVVIHNDAVIGDRVHIDQSVTIGGTASSKGTPEIGSDVYVGAGAKILGPITIGDNVVVGANAVVISDIPSGSVVVGAPARVVKSNIILKDFLSHLG